LTGKSITGVKYYTLDSTRHHLQSGSKTVRGDREDVQLEEVLADQRAPILKTCSEHRERDGT
jgi:hypothetical protein